jgi:uncharacterized membrane protein
MIRNARKAAGAGGEPGRPVGRATGPLFGRRPALAGLLALGSSFVAAGGTTTYVFVCDDEATYTVRTGSAGARVFGPGQSLTLPAVATEPARRYSDGDFELRIEGERAWLGERVGELRECRNDRRRAVWERARLDGVDFRAVGNEPGWYLEIHEQSRVVLVSDYGTARVEMPLPEPGVKIKGDTTRWDAGELRVEAMRRPCTDTMSGERFPSQVTVYREGRILRGCGRALHQAAAEVSASDDGALGLPVAQDTARIGFDLNRLDDRGLQGPPDGLRALHYEYCIPDRPEAAREVAAIDPTLQIQRGPAGRIGCGADQLLCLGHTHQPDYTGVLRRLAELPWIGEIRETFFE